MASGRPMTQQELAKAMKREVGRGLSQAYLSQIESGTRPHLTHGTRTLLARFFRVYPGFLVDDPEGYTPELQSSLRAVDAKIDSWLYAAAEQFAADPELRPRPFGRSRSTKIRAKRFCFSRRFFARRVWPTVSERFCIPASRKAVDIHRLRVH